MAGEMFKATRDEWPIHFAIADATRGTVKPFDYYQGPYVVIGRDIRIGTAPYQVAPTHLGVIRLWVVSDDGIVAQIYREDTEELSSSFLTDDPNDAVEATMELLSKEGVA